MKSPPEISARRSITGAQNLVVFPTVASTVASAADDGAAECAREWAAAKSSSMTTSLVERQSSANPRATRSAATMASAVDSRSGGRGRWQGLAPPTSAAVAQVRDRRPSMRALLVGTAAIPASVRRAIRWSTDAVSKTER